MTGVAVTFEDEITPLMARVRTAAGREGMAVEIGRAAQQTTREHLFRLDRARHKGGRHYYAQAARSTHQRSVTGGVMISINQVGIRQRYYGGTIRPRGKYLTIPASTRTQGTRAREYNDLEFRYVLDPKLGAVRPALVRKVSTAPALAERVKGSRRVTPAETFTGEIMFWLVRKVTQRADPSVLPDRKLLVRSMFAAAEARLARLAAAPSS